VRVFSYKKKNTISADRAGTADTEPVSAESRIRWFREYTPNKHPLWVVKNKNREIIGWVSFQSFYSFLILTLAVEYAIFSMERTIYIKKDMS